MCGGGSIGLGHGAVVPTTVFSRPRVMLHCQISKTRIGDNDIDIDTVPQTTISLPGQFKANCRDFLNFLL